MANVQVFQRHAHLAGAVRLEFVNGREGKVAKAVLTAISNSRRASRDGVEGREEEATAIQWTLWGKQAENAAEYLGKGIQGMSWVEFEQLLSEAFRRQGYRVKETGGGGADGGIDLQLERAGQIELVQCKHWRAFKVGVPVVREMLGLVTAHKAAGGWVITSGRFTAEARQFADGKPLQLVDGVGLAELLMQGAGVRPTTVTEAPAATRPAVAAPAGDATSSVAAPFCPKCGRAMVRRTASKGANAGQWFWGCGGFPGCRGTRAAV